MEIFQSVAMLVFFLFCRSHLKMNFYQFVVMLASLQLCRSHLTMNFYQFMAMLAFFQLCRSHLTMNFHQFVAMVLAYFQLCRSHLRLAAIYLTVKFYSEDQRRVLLKLATYINYLDDPRARSAAIKATGRLSAALTALNPELRSQYIRALADAINLDRCPRVRAAAVNVARQLSTALTAADHESRLRYILALVDAINEHNHLRVRAAAINAIQRLFNDFNEDLQIQYHPHVLPVLVEEVLDSNNSLIVLELAAAAMINICMNRLEFTVSYLCETVAALLEASASSRSWLERLKLPGGLVDRAYILQEDINQEDINQHHIKICASIMPLMHFKWKLPRYTWATIQSRLSPKQLDEFVLIWDSIWEPLTFDEFVLKLGKEKVTYRASARGTCPAEVFLCKKTKKQKNELVSNLKRFLQKNKQLVPNLKRSSLSTFNNIDEVLN